MLHHLQGHGVIVINHLISEAKKLGIKKLSIETGAGDFFIPARKLFKTCGFEPCEPFAHYKDDINSVYLKLFSTCQKTTSPDWILTASEG